MADIGFHAAIIESGVWAADLVTAGVVRAAGAVYDGRNEQGVSRMDTEVWIELDDTGEALGRGFQGMDSYPYLLHVKVKSPSNKGPAKTGSAQVRALVAKLRTIEERYHATRTFYGTVPEIKVVSAERIQGDARPSDGKSIVGTVRVTFYATRSDPGLPSTILGSDLLLWLDPSNSSTLTSDTNGASALANRVPGGTPASLTQSVNANKPTVGTAAVNGLDTLQGDGTGQWLAGTPPKTSPPFYVWVVVKPDVTTDRFFWGMNDASAIDFDPAWVGQGDPSGEFVVTATASVLPNTTNSYSADETILVEYRETATNDRAVILNGDDANEGTDTTTVDPGGTGLVDLFTIMAGVANSGGSVSGSLDGDFCELVFSGAIPTTSQRDAIRNYLATKWGVTLA